MLTAQHINTMAGYCRRMKLSIKQSMRDWVPLLLPHIIQGQEPAVFISRTTDDGAAPRCCGTTFTHRRMEDIRD